MIRWLIYFVIVGLLAWAGVWVAEHPGHVSIDWEGYRVDTSIGIIVLMLAVAGAVVLGVYRLWLELRRAPGSFQRARRNARMERGYRALSQGMAAVAAGDRTDARRYALRADDLLDDPPLTLLLSAQAAQLNGDENAAQQYFQGMLEREETRFLGLRGLLNQALRRDDRAAALAYARQAHEVRPKSGLVLSELYELLVQDGNWGEADAVLERAIRQGAVPAESGRRDQAAIKMVLSRAAEARGETAEALKLARTALKLSAGFVPAATAAARLQAGDGARRRARRTLSDAWATAPHPDLVAAFLGLVPAAGPLARFKELQGFLQGSAPHLHGDLALAEAALAADLWGEARMYLDRVEERDGRTVQLCRLRAALAEAENEDLVEAREWLSETATAQPDPAWVCGNCGATDSAWEAECGNCSAFNQYEWRVPPRIVHLEDDSGPASLSLPGQAKPPAASPATHPAGAAETTLDTASETGPGTEPGTASDVRTGRLEEPTRSEGV